MINLDGLEKLIALGESTEREFKSDRRQLSDRVMDLCQVTRSQAYYLLKNMCDAGILKLCGQKRGAYYTLKNASETHE